VNWSPRKAALWSELFDASWQTKAPYFRELFHYAEELVMVDREEVPSCTEVRAQSIVRDTKGAVTVVTGLDRVAGGES